MNEHDVRELLKLVRGIEHFLERCLRTMTEKQLKEKGIQITPNKKEDDIPIEYETEFPL